MSLSVKHAVEALPAWVSLRVVFILEGQHPLIEPDGSPFHAGQVNIRCKQISVILLEIPALIDALGSSQQFLGSRDLNHLGLLFRQQICTLRYAHQLEQCIPWLESFLKQRRYFLKLTADKPIGHRSQDSTVTLSLIGHLPDPGLRRYS